MKVVGLIFGVAMGALVVSAIPVSADDWPHWRGPNRDGIAPETGWFHRWTEGGPQKLWSAEVGTGFSSVAVSDGALFTMGNSRDKDTVYCLDAGTGKARWAHTYDCKLDPNNYEGGPLSTPSVNSGRVYTLSKEGHLLCLNATDGNVIWSHHLITDFQAVRPRWGFTASPVVLSDFVVVTAGGKGSACIALRKTDGQLVWKAGDDPGGYATSQPFVWEKRTLFAEFNGFGLVIRDLGNGAESARLPWRTSYDINAITPIVDEGRVFIASGYSRGGALLEFRGDALQEVWKQKRIRSDFTTPVLWRKYLYGIDDRALVCIEFNTGAVRWTQDGFGKGALVASDGILIVQTQESGELVLVEASPLAYKELARAKVFDGDSCVMPVLANSRLYAKSNTGAVVCLDVRRK